MSTFTSPRAPGPRGSIFKYVLEATDWPQIVGEGLILRPLTVAWQGGDLCLWAEARPPQIVGRARDCSTGLEVIVLLTGQEIPRQADKFIGSAVGGPSSMFASDGMVAHVYTTHR